MLKTKTYFVYFICLCGLCAYYCLMMQYLTAIITTQHLLLLNIISEYKFKEISDEK